MKAWLVVLAGMTTLAPLAHAQTGRHVALGPGAALYHYADGDFKSAEAAVALIDRINGRTHPKDGTSFGILFSPEWFRADVSADSGGARVRVGRLSSIPLLLGLGPSWRHGRTEVGFGVLAGPGFHHLDRDPGIAPVHVSTSVAVQPEASVWYDVSSRLGLHAGVSYLYDRPRVEPDSTGTSVRWKADQLDLEAGFAIGIF